jgi:antitoxin component HigA of HigAB toxin-antitoxin module
VLSGKRDLSLAMIRRLHLQLNIPADVLLGVSSKEAA